MDLDLFSIDQERKTKLIDDLTNERSELQSRVEMLTNLAKSIDEISLHPRVEARCKLSKFVDVECLLTTSEYKLKYGDYSVVSSLKGTNQYIQKSIDDCNKMIVVYNENIAKSKEQKLLAEMSCGSSDFEKINEIHTIQGSVTYYDNGLVDIVEKDTETKKKSTRMARFKTLAERENYLKQYQSNKEQKD